MKCFSNLNNRLLVAGTVLVLTLNSTLPLCAGDTAPNEKYTIVKSAGDLAEQVRSMHEALLSAARSGDLEEVRAIFESNELAPMVSQDHTGDPIEYWKQQSIDGSGRDFLAAITEILTLPPVRSKNGNYIWPYLAKKPLSDLSKTEQITLFRIAGPKNAAAMLKANKYSYFTLMISKDGTWHYFKK